jgi:hypothetical protein
MQMLPDPQFSHVNMSLQSASPRQTQTGPPHEYPSLWNCPMDALIAAGTTPVGCFPHPRTLGGHTTLDDAPRVTWAVKPGNLVIFILPLGLLPTDTS